MLLIIVGLLAGVLLFARMPRLERAAENDASVRAYVDGKRVESYVKED
jgi:hypothetical protein